MPPSDRVPPTDAAAAPASRPLSQWASTLQSELPEATARERVATRLDLCHSTLAFRVIALVQVAVGVSAMLHADSAALWAFHAPVAAVAALAGTLGWLAAVCLSRHAVARLTAPWRAALAVTAGAAAGLAGWALLPPLGLEEPNAWRAGASALGGATLAAAVWAWLGWREQAARPADASARLAELQSRIRPHFLFNALNTALALVRLDPARAEAVLEDLAELFRAALAEAGAAVSLAEEVELAQRYLAIEQARFGERLVVTWELDPAASRARVPPLVLQPLVENAVRHGIEPMAGGGQVLVRTQVKRGMVSVTVRNTVGDQPSRPGNGMALANVRERLRLLHDMGATLDAARDGGHFVARMVVPL